MPQLTSEHVDSQCQGPKCAPACHSGLDKLRRDLVGCPTDQRKFANASCPDNQAVGHSGQLALANFRWSVGQPGRSLLRVPGAPQPPGTQCPCSQGHWDIGKSAGQSGQPSLQRLPALQHLPGCLFLKSYLNTPPPGIGSL